jgi:hypothetical protein
LSTWLSRPGAAEPFFPLPRLQPRGLLRRPVSFFRNGSGCSPTQDTDYLLGYACRFRRGRKPGSTPKFPSQSRPKFRVRWLVLAVSMAWCYTGNSLVLQKHPLGARQVTRGPKYLSIINVRTGIARAYSNGILIRYFFRYTHTGPRQQGSGFPDHPSDARPVVCVNIS